MADFRSRAGHQIPKPKDWQAFQRGCAILFRAELADPNALEYGRNGQKQNGIDVLGRRNGSHDHFVGIQCRLIEKPMTRDEIMADCRAALTIRAGLKEIIFATSLPSDVKATDEAIDVERELRAGGYDLTVSLYSWSDLEMKIAQHPTAYDYFFLGPLASLATDASEGGSPAGAASFAPLKPLDGLGKFRVAGGILGAVENFPNQDSVVKLCDGPVIWFRLMPTINPDRTWSVMQLKQMVGLQFICPVLHPPEGMRYLRGSDGFGTIVRFPDMDDAVAVAFVFRSGEVWAVDTFHLSVVNEFIPPLEKGFHAALFQYARLLSALGLQSPYRWEIGAEGLSGRRLSQSGSSRASGQCLTDLVIASGTYSPGDSIGQSLRPFFERLYDACGMARHSDLN